MFILGNVDVRQLLLDLAQNHTVSAVLATAVKRLAAGDDSALVRIWLVEPGDACTECADAPRCSSKGNCLHLKASAGKSRTCERQWDNIDASEFRRFPMGVRKVGLIAVTGLSLEVSAIENSEEWIADPDWIRTEGITSFAGQPLICKGNILGVLAVFSRRPFEAGGLDLLRMVADHIAYAIANANAFEVIEELQKRREAENAFLRDEITEIQHFKGIIGSSRQIDEVRTRISLVAPTDTTVLIQGPSGSGKEIVAREIHQQSERRNSPMIRVNCAAIPRELFESEFFGHRKGSFTGAVRDRVGYFQAADGGTLFLDEVSEIPLEQQGKLLRVLQEGEYRRVGESSHRKVNIRLIAATNRDILSYMRTGAFREDLYYRLQVFPILLPGLKERPEDIPILAEHFIRLVCRKMRKRPFILSDEHIKAMLVYAWPGNIRELRNLIERIAITGQPGQVLSELSASSQTSVPSPLVEAAGFPDRLPLTETQMRELEKRNMQAALQQSNWLIYGKRGAARLLGIKPTTLISRLKRMGLYQRG